MARQLDLTKTASKQDTKTSAEQQILDEQQKEQQAKEEEEEQKLKSAGLSREGYEIEVNNAGVTPQGALYISIINTGNTEAVVNGKRLNPGEEKIYPFVGKGYREIPYTAEDSTLRIRCIL